MATVSLEAIDRQIARGFPALRFSPAVEAEFLQEYVANRVKLTPFWAVVGTLIYDAVFIGDATMMADVFDKLLIVRFGIFTPFAIISVLAVRRWRTALNYELLSLGIGTLSILLPMSVAIYSQSPYMFVYQNGNVAAFLFFVIALRPRFHIVVIGLTLMCGVLLKTAKLNGSFDDITYSGLISFYITIAIFLALSAYFLEHTDRLNFLNRLRAGLLQQQLEHNAARDELSGLLNRRSLVQVATDMWKGKTAKQNVFAPLCSISMTSSFTTMCTAIWKGMSVCEPSASAFATMPVKKASPSATAARKCSCCCRIPMSTTPVPQQRPSASQSSA